MHIHIHSAAYEMISIGAWHRGDAWTTVFRGEESTIALSFCSFFFVFFFVALGQ